MGVLCMRLLKALRDEDTKARRLLVWSDLQPESFFVPLCLRAFVVNPKSVKFDANDLQHLGHLRHLQFPTH